ncbi:hypothetical protein CcCBS67573_g00950 [Chytriomyces confervae]|uniref:Uncharacterized protein n=1 Tax=Chytriomyces confervae TaxID=246404 RepID=A0A507FSA8_9FUNG|nr:Leucine-rich repeat-containing protein 40 [Chytriomyces hyalinus]TPX77787.1 hypothetical protein CcCBS67573_g00950 [Chytriomyces confervae]
MLRNRAGPNRFGANTGREEESNQQTAIKLVQQSRTSGRLNLSNQSLKALPNALFTREDVTAKAAAEAKANWWEEVDLTKLSIADNELAAIDERISQFGALTSIDAHNNQLTVLPDLSQLQCLTILQLNSNKLTLLPDSLFDLPLAELQLAHNLLIEIPPSFSKLAPSLVNCDVSNNQLSALPASLGRFRVLTKFTAKSNKLAGSLGYMCVPTLTHLDVSHNKLSNLGDLTGCAQLQDLNASQNVLTSLFTNNTASKILLPSLVLLDVRINRLTTLGSGLLIYTPLLKELLASGNLLTDVCGSGLLESGLKGLETLDVRDNSLPSVPEVVVEMDSLKRLFLEGNPIRVPRRAIMEKGTAAILLWMRERAAPA